LSIILLKTKQEAKKVKQEITNFLSSKLDLTLNNKSKYYPNELGVDFCGYRIYETHRLLRKRSKNKIRKLIKKLIKIKIMEILTFNISVCAIILGGPMQAMLIPIIWSENIIVNFFFLLI